MGLPSEVQVVETSIPRVLGDAGKGGLLGLPPGNEGRYVLGVEPARGLAWLGEGWDKA